MTQPATSRHQHPQVRLACSNCIEGLCRTLIFIVSVGLGIFLIVIGALNINECPIEPALPILVMIGGILFLLLHVTKMMAFTCTKFMGDTDSNKVRCKKFMTFFGIIGLIIFTIVAIYLVVIIWQTFLPNFSKSYGDQYCNGVVYSSAIMLLILPLSIGAVICLSFFFASLSCICFMVADPLNMRHEFQDAERLQNIQN